MVKRCWIVLQIRWWGLVAGKGAGEGKTSKNFPDPKPQTSTINILTRTTSLQGGNLQQSGVSHSCGRKDDTRMVKMIVELKAAKEWEKWPSGQRESRSSKRKGMSRND